MGPFYFEDFNEGDVHRYGRYTVTREEILEFANKYDPQPFHTDEEAAAESIFGGLVASGWHTCAMFMRMFAEGMLGGDSGSLGSPGVDDIRWLRPVRPGMTLSVKSRVTQTRPSESKPDRGLVRMEHAVLDGDEEPVMTLDALGFFRRREHKG